MPIAERPADNEYAEGRVILSEADAREAARLLRVLTYAGGYFPEGDDAAERELSQEQLIARARVILHSRQARARHFSRVMFGEPAWDILLLLYVDDLSGQRFTLGKLAEQIDTPLSTVIRWVDYLELQKLAERQRHPTDKRIIFVRLLPKGRQKMDDYLREMCSSLKF